MIIGVPKEIKNNENKHKASENRIDKTLKSARKQGKQWTREQAEIYLAKKNSMKPRNP